MTLRELFIEWLTASRFIRSLETRYAEQRADFQERLGEKDARIKELRTEIAGLKIECDRMRTVLMPFGSPAGAAYAQRWEPVAKPPAAPAFDGVDDWQAELNRMYKEEEHGIHGERRQKIHEQTPDDGA